MPCSSIYPTTYPFFNTLSTKNRNKRKGSFFPPTLVNRSSAVHHQPPFSFFFFLSFLVFSTVLFRYSSECWQLVIKNVTIPSMVKANDTDHVILDCDYDLEDTPSKGLVVKWFFNADEVAYQWIYGRKPLAGDVLSNYVELNYPASDDPYTMFRAIKLNNPDIELSGEYRCVISTFADEKSASGSMIVYCEYILPPIWLNN